MRLLHTSSLELHEYADNDIPPYAILSHMWGKQEVTFQDTQSGAAALKGGFSKIHMCANQASLDGWDYVWVDTCCIDKSSSSELTEAINSMYRWYKGSKVCYAYLEDVPNANKPLTTNSSFCHSRWFSRGWTLQELIAPSDVIFFTSDWVSIGGKTDNEVRSVVSKITGIPEEVLIGGNLSAVSIAQRMSWAASRKTTRVEDLAYSLLGIFDVNMPLLYGEGEKAFLRLQQEIMKDSDDHSLFAWRDASFFGSANYSGLLARSPAYYEQGGNLKPYHDWNAPTVSYSFTNKGLRIGLQLIEEDIEEGIFIAILDCRMGSDTDKYVGIYLKCLSDNADQFCRVNADTLKVLGSEHAERVENSKPRTLYIRQTPLTLNYDENLAIRTIEITYEPNSYLFRSEIHPEHLWQGEFGSMKLHLTNRDGRVAAVFATIDRATCIKIAFWVTRSGFCVFRIAGYVGFKTLEETGTSEDTMSPLYSCFGYRKSAQSTRYQLENIHLMHNIWIITPKTDDRGQLCLNVSAKPDRLGLRQIRNDTLQ